MHNLFEFIQIGSMRNKSIPNYVTLMSVDWICKDEAKRARSTNNTRKLLWNVQYKQKIMECDDRYLIFIVLKLPLYLISQRFVHIKIHTLFSHKFISLNCTAPIKKQSSSRGWCNINCKCFWSNDELYMTV